MRRVTTIIIALIAILFVQFTWAAAASYCSHENNLASNVTTHFGHHEHEHADSSKGGGKPVQMASPGSMDNDCSTCNFGVLQPLAAFGTSVLSADSAVLYQQSSRPYGSHIPIVPERPDIVLPL